jgi:hypothetical protein
MRILQRGCYTQGRPGYAPSVEPDYDVIIPIVMIAAVVLIGVVILVAVIRAVSRAAAISLAAGIPGTGFVVPQGLRARGLVLNCNRTASGVTVNGRRFEQRSMMLDVEIPGRTPFVASGTFLVPRGIVDTVPGTSLELSVDPSNMNQITVLGPGGFTGPWLNFGPPNSY